MTPLEAAARAICDEWGYLWDAPPDDEQSTGTGKLGDERPTKRLYRKAARAAAIAMVGELSDKQIERVIYSDETMDAEPNFPFQARAELVKQLTEE